MHIAHIQSCFAALHPEKYFHRENQFSKPSSGCEWLWSQLVAGKAWGRRHHWPRTQSGPDQTRPDQTRPDQTRPVKAKCRTWRSGGNVLWTEETAGDWGRSLPAAELGWVAYIPLHPLLNLCTAVKLSLIELLTSLGGFTPSLHSSTLAHFNSNIFRMLRALLTPEIYQSLRIALGSPIILYFWKSWPMLFSIFLTLTPFVYSISKSSTIFLAFLIRLSHCAACSKDLFDIKKLGFYFSPAVTEAHLWSILFPTAFCLPRKVICKYFLDSLMPFTNKLLPIILFSFEILFNFAQCGCSPWRQKVSCNAAGKTTLQKFSVCLVWYNPICLLHCV